jgi:carbamate kinase
MRIVTSVFTGMALAVAGIMTFSTADTVLAQTKKQDQTSTAQSQPQVLPSDQRFGTDRQLQGRFYKRHKTHKQSTQKTPDTESK